MIADVMLAAHAQIEHLSLKEQQERLGVVQEALTWLKTPYHHQGRLLGIGVDCGMFLLEVFEKTGHIPFIDPRPYPPDWHLHQSEQKYLGWVEKYAHRVGTPLPGDLVLYRYGRCLSHGAIVTAWPEVIHSYLGIGVTRSGAEEAPLEARRVAGFWSIWGGV